MNPPFLHCMWSDRMSRLSLTGACEFFSFSTGWTYPVPVWTLFGPVLVPCGLVDNLYPSGSPASPVLDCGSIVGFVWTIGETLV